MAKKKIESDEKQPKLSFLDQFNTDCEDIDGISLSSPSPKYWLDAGNYCINKVLSGSYSKGIASGRLAAFTGPSGSGKSFIMGNLIKSALSKKDVDWGVLAIDSENALDDNYLNNIGANIDNNPLYNYRGVSTISQTVNII